MTTPDTMKPIGDLSRDITLRATLTRIARKAEIMRLDAARGSTVRQDAEEIALLAGIAQRCLEGGE